MATANEVANHLILIAGSEVEPEYLTPLRLQKLVYYAQGWSLGYRGDELFAEDLEAWQHGPVVPSLYRRFRDYKWKPIIQESLEDTLGPNDRFYVALAWNRYKNYSANMLRNMTHSEPPWLDVRTRVNAGESCGATIPKQSMRDFFGQESLKAQLKMKVPDWSGFKNRKLLDTAQRILIKRDDLFFRLAQ